MKALRSPHILHVVPDTVSDPRHHFLGSTKDARGRTDYFQARGFSFEELSVPGRSDEWLYPRLQEMELGAFTAAVFELPIYPRSLAHLRQSHPHLQILVRSINAEFFHRLHLSWAEEIDSGPHDPRVWDQLRRGFSRLHFDLLCARAADCLLSITQWETENYWSYLVEGSRVRTLPYFLPEVYRLNPHLPEKKLARCVCLQSTAPNPMIRDAARGFRRVVEWLGNRLPSWEFIMTGDLPPADENTVSRIRYTGLVENPFDLLTEASAIAILSDYGFGFKTKILEAILHRCFVLVTPRLHSRLPDEVLPYCLAVDLNAPATFETALEQSQQPFPPGDLNEAFRKEAYAALDQIFMG